MVFSLLCIIFSMYLFALVIILPIYVYTKVCIKIGSWREKKQHKNTTSEDKKSEIVIRFED